MQDDGDFHPSEHEVGASVRALHGVWWNDRWECQKVLYAKFPDGTRKAVASMHVYALASVICACALALVPHTSVRRLVTHFH